MKFNSFLVGQPTNKKNIQSNQDYLRILSFIQTEQRAQRNDLKEISQKIDRLLVDKHLQSQVDDFFQDHEHPPIEDLD